MASTFSLISSSYEGRYMSLSCSQSKDAATNRSTITWTLTVTGGSVKYYSTGPTTVTINGTNVYYCARKDWTTKTFPAAKGSISGTIPVDHNQYGDASIVVSLSTAINTGTVSTRSDTWYLDNIPRASQPSLSSTNFNIGDSITIYTNRASSSFTHTVRYSWGDKNGIIATNVTNNCNWTIPTNFAENIPTAPYGQGAVYLDTYNGSTLIGTKSINFTAYVPDYKVSEPTESSARIWGTKASTGTQDNFNTFPNDNKVIFDWNQNGWNKAVKGFNRIKYYITPGPSKYSNYVKKYYVTLIKEQNDFSVPGVDVRRLMEENWQNGDSAHAWWTDYLTDVGTFCLKITIQDSRDKITDFIIRDQNDSTKPLKITVYDYNPPKIQEAIAFRCNSEGIATDVGTYLSLGCSGVVGSSIGDRNSVSVVYQWKLVGDEYSAKSSIPNDPISGFNVTNSYEVKFTVKDTIGTETTKIISIPLGKTDFNLTPYGAGFGMYHDSNKPNTLQSAWDLDIKGNLMVDFVVEQGVSENCTYRKWRSGIAECWGTYSYDGIQTSADFGVTYLYPEIALPVDFIERPCATISSIYQKRWNQIIGDFTITNPSNLSEAPYNKIHSFAIHTSGSTSVGGTLAYHIIGRWK